MQRSCSARCHIVPISFGDYLQAKLAREAKDSFGVSFAFALTAFLAFLGAAGLAGFLLAFFVGILRLLFRIRLLFPEAIKGSMD